MAEQKITYTPNGYYIQDKDRQGWTFHELPEIIRCKDCKHYDGRPCGIVDWYNTADDFCSKGERRTDEIN